MRRLRGSFTWGLCPQTPGIYRFFSARMGNLGFQFRGQAFLSPPFRPLNRSLGSHPCVALSRPVQVGSVSTSSFPGSIKKQRTAITPLTSCLTIGVHRSPCPRLST